MGRLRGLTSGLLLLCGFGVGYCLTHDLEILSILPGIGCLGVAGYDLGL